MSLSGDNDSDPAQELREETGDLAARLLDGMDAEYLESLEALDAAAQHFVGVLLQRGMTAKAAAAALGGMMGGIIWQTCGVVDDG